ncbi:MAG: DMT family transporter [bacterium]
MISKHSKVVDYSIVLLLTFIWGFSWPVTIVGLRHCDPILLGSLRCILGGLGLWLWRLRSPKKEHYDAQAIQVAVIVGLLWVGIPMALTIWGLQYISGGLGSILQSTVPFFIAILAHFYLKENQLNIIRIIGLLLGFAGVLVLFSDDSFSTESRNVLLGGLAILFSSVTIGMAQVYARKHFKGHDQIGFGMWMQITAGLIVLPFSWISGVPKFEVTIEMLLALGYLGFIGSALAFTLYFDLLQRVDIVALSMMAYIIPIVAVIAGIIWLGESMSMIDIAGSVLIMAGVVVATQYQLIKSKLIKRST